MFCTRGGIRNWKRRLPSQLLLSPLLPGQFRRLCVSDVTMRRLLDSVDGILFMLQLWIGLRPNVKHLPFGIINFAFRRYIKPIDVDDIDP